MRPLRTGRERQANGQSGRLLQAARGGVKTPPYGFFFERPQAAEHHNFHFYFLIFNFLWFLFFNF